MSTDQQFPAGRVVRISARCRRISCVRAAIHQRGISLIELIIFIVIVSVALAGILLVMDQVAKHSADPLIRKQAIAIAESLLEEIALQDYIDGNDGVTTACPAASAVTPTNRGSYHIVDCYKGFPNGGATPGIYDLSGAVVPGLENYSATVAMYDGGLGGIAAGHSVRIAVTVTTPQGDSIVIEGYRTKY
jgi:MSHA pilin protein MshD